MGVEKTEKKYISRIRLYLYLVEEDKERKKELDKEFNDVFENHKYNLLKAYIDLGIEYMKLNHYAKARKILLEAKQIDPNSKYYTYCVDKSLHDLEKRCDEAEKKYREAIPPKAKM
ncbi:MAG: hypothetical protein CVU81_02945 [Euryarchaeota archaeon HGW-Euryarchaeota-1]|nr:MAG: hypothetical protein CVU81_02945 [Euryarchaeota archaeon HGW-Euryarchaeota-1]